MSTTDEILEMIHKAAYHKSAKLDAPENQNEFFKAGYETGKTMDENADTFLVINKEFKRIGNPSYLPSSFMEWKRGLWAAVIRRALKELKT